MKQMRNLAVLTVTLGVAGCSTQAPLETLGSGTPAAKAVEILDVNALDSPTFYEASGTVRAQLNATLASKVMARVVAVSVREGDAVYKGQRLVSLDSRELAAGVKVAQANLSASMVGVDSARTAHEMEAKSSAARIAQSAAAVEQSRAALASAQSKLDLALAGPRVQEKAQAHLAVVQADAALKLAKTQLDRATRLVAEGALPRRSLEEAQMAHDVALAQRDSAVQAERMAQEGSRTQDIQTAREGVAQAQAAVKQAEANLRYAQAAALQTKVRSQDIRAARTQVGQSSAALDSARVSLAYGSVSAPFDGRVVARAADPGAMALPGSPLLALEGGPLRLEAVVPESILRHVKLGDRVRLKIDALDRETEGTVDEIVPQGDASSHTFLVKLKLANSSGVHSAMFGRAFFTTGTSQDLQIPVGASWEREGLRYVYVVNAEGLARLRIITLGQTVDGRVKVLTGLSPGERIVASAREAIADGMKVTAR